MNNLELLKVYQFDKKERLGCLYDGGYVIAQLDCSYDCYISAGVGYDDKFSIEFIDKYGINALDCFAFDGTVESYPYPEVHDTHKINFVQKNIATHNDENHTNLDELLNKYENIFLKMDIEGGEFPWINSLNDSELTKLKQIVIEIHGLSGDSFGTSYNNKVTCLEKLANTHYLVHAHGNNYSHILNGIPDVIELTYIQKRYFDTPPPLNSLPLPAPGLDFSNKDHSSDYDLNHYPFVFHETTETTN